MDINQWFPWVFSALCFVIGWLSGALLGSQEHLKSIQSHIAWLNEYTATVNELLTQFADIDAVRNEREECARIADRRTDAIDIAHFIRKRGEG